jgi:phosphate:Na+ symporter
MPYVRRKIESLGSILLVDLAGAVALLLWGLHMVHTGIIRTFGSDLRRFLNYALRNRFTAFATGLGLTAILQSSTATALMTTSLAAENLVGLMPALAIMLGANVGTTLIVQVLSFNIYAASPFLLFAGFVAHKMGKEGRFHDLGRVMIGLGLIILALHILLELLSPAESAPAMRELLKIVTDEPVLCILIGAVITWAAHSSVATVLLVISLAQSQFVTPEASIALVLGANLGSALNPLFEGGSKNDLASKRVPIGNLLNRLFGIVIVLPFIGQIASFGMQIQHSPALLASSFHLGFNLILALLFILPLNSIAAMLVHFLPENENPSDPGCPRYLNETAFMTPAIALADAARETLRIGDLIETMLQGVMTALLANDKRLVDRISQMDDVVDRLEKAVRLYITKLTRETLSEYEARRAAEIISFAINLEHVGDIIDKNLRELAIKKIKKNANFSSEGAIEIEIFYKRVLESLKLALGVFMTGDAESARKLITEKSEIRLSERLGTEKHLIRLREGRSESLETSSLHVDTLRDLKRIHSHICSVAYSFSQAQVAYGTE